MDIKNVLDFYLDGSILEISQIQNLGFCEKLFQCV